MQQHKDHCPHCKLHNEYSEICLYIFTYALRVEAVLQHSNTSAQKQKYAFTFAYQNMLSPARACLALLRN